MKTKTLILASFILIFLILSISFSLATNAKTKTGKMILRDVVVGEEVEKFIWLINDNEFPVKITFTISGDLKENVIFEEVSYTLQAGEEKQFEFTIKATTPGSHTTKITSIFTPELEDETAVGITTSVILITKENEIITDTPSDSKNNKLPKISLVITSIILIAVILFVYFDNKTKNRNKRSTKKRV